jgi:hypothetical protein
VPADTAGHSTAQGPRNRHPSSLRLATIQSPSVKNSNRPGPRTAFGLADLLCTWHQNPTVYSCWRYDGMHATYWTQGWKCLWRGHSVNENRPLLSDGACAVHSEMIVHGVVGPFASTPAVLKGLFGSKTCHLRKQSLGGTTPPSVSKLR